MRVAVFSTKPYDRRFLDATVSQVVELAEIAARPVPAPPGHIAESSPAVGPAGAGG